ncbi:type III pantothenate kinase [Thalassotalea sp. PLHSN55]|uniref:type III pantothenate kinase n=1 Tax=Thalassotalea sp. PLHSN55 TaxID=3435888 RepID=UPI003F85D1E5
MIILIDIGNTRCKYITVNHGQFSELKSINNSELTTKWCDNHWHDADKIIVASVKIGEAAELINQWCSAINKPFQRVITEAEKNGVSIAYQNPQQLGVDRWLAILAVATLYTQQNIIVVDAGTATTVDLVSAKGKHLGGWILPGIEMMVDSLKLNTDQVKVNPQHINNIALGSTTSDCVNGAIWASTLGMIEQAYIFAQQHNIDIDNIVVTGGNGEKLSKLMTRPSLNIPTLVFTGLAQYI